MAADATSSIEGVAAQIRQLRACWCGDLSGALPPEELLDALHRLDKATRDLRITRDTVLTRARGGGVSWTEISAKTGVPATTWRGRYDRHTGVDQP